MLAFVSPGWTLAVTKIALRLLSITSGTLSGLFAVKEILGTGKPLIVLQSKVRSYTKAYLVSLRPKFLLSSTLAFTLESLG